MSAERVIEIKDVTKIYKLYDKPIDRLKESMSLRHRSYHKDFYALRGTVERLLHSLGIDAVVEAGGDNYLHPGRKAVLKAGDQVVCTLGEVHPDVRERFEMPARAYLAELNLTLLAELVKPMGAVKPMPRYPAVTRDLALVMAEDTQVGPLLRDMAAAAGKILEDARMFDVYRSPLLGADKKSVAFSFTLRGADRTLTEAEVAKAMDNVRRVAEEKYGAVIRG